MIKSYTKTSNNILAAQFNFTNAFSIMEKLVLVYGCTQLLVDFPTNGRSGPSVTFINETDQDNIIQLNDYVIFGTTSFEIVPEKDFNKNYKINA